MGRTGNSPYTLAACLNKDNDHHYEPTEYNRRHDNNKATTKTKTNETNKTTAFPHTTTARTRKQAAPLTNCHTTANK